MDRTATVRAEKNTVPELPAAPGSLPRDEVVGKTQVTAPDDGLEKTLAPANLQARWVQSLKKEIMEGVGSAVQQELRTFREDITEALGSVKAEVQVFHRDWAKESEAHPAASRSSASGKGSQSAPAERESVDQSEVLRAIRESRTVMVSALESVRSQLEDAREDIRAGEAPRERRAPEDASAVLRALREHESKLNVDVAAILRAVRQTKADVVQLVKDAPQAQADLRPVLEGIEEVRAQVDLNRTLAAVQAGVDAVGEVRRDLGAARREDLDGPTRRGPASEPKAVSCEPVLMAIAELRQELSLLKGVRGGRAETSVDLKPLMALVQALDDKTEVEASRVVQAIEELRAHVDPTPVLAAIESVQETDLQRIQASLHEVRRELDQRVLAAVHGCRNEAKADLQPVLAEIRRFREEVDFKRVLAAIRDSRKEDVDYGPLITAVADTVTESVGELRLAIGQSESASAKGARETGEKWNEFLSVVKTALQGVRGEVAFKIEELGPRLDAVHEAIREMTGELSESLDAALGASQAELQRASLEPLATAVQDVRKEVDLRRTLDFIAASRAEEVDMKPVLASLSELRCQIGEIRSRTNPQPLLEAVGEIQAMVGMGPSQYQVDLQVLHTAIADMQALMNSQLTVLEDGKVDLSPVLHAIRESEAVQETKTEAGFTRTLAAMAEGRRDAETQAAALRETMSTARVDLGQALDKAAVRAGDDVLALKADLRKAVGQATGQARVEISGLKADLGQTVDQLKAELGKALGAEVARLNVDLTQVVGQAAGKVSGEVSSLKVDLGQAVGMAAGRVIAEVSHLKADLSQAVDSAAAKRGDDISSLKVDLGQALDNAVAKTGEEVLGLKAELRNAIGQATGQARVEISGLKANLGQTVEQLRTELCEALGAEIARLNVDLTQVVGEATGKVSEEVLGLKTDLSQAVDQGVGKMSEEVSGLKTDLGQVVDQGVGKMSTDVSGLKDYVADMSKAVGEATSKMSLQVSGIKDDLGQSLVEAAGKVEGVGTQTAMVLAAISTAKTDISRTVGEVGAQVAEVLQAAREIPDNIDQSCVLQAIRESAAGVEPVDLTPVLVQLREGSAETKAALHSVVSSVRESGAEVLHAVVQSKKESDFAMLRTTRDHKAEVDVVPLMQAIQDGKTDVDLSALMASFKHSSRLVDLKPVLSAIQRSRADVDFATALAAAVHLAKVVTACEGLAAFKDQQPLVGGSMVASSSMKHANTYSGPLGPPSPSGSSRFIPSALKSVLKK